MRHSKSLQIALLCFAFLLFSAASYAQDGEGETYSIDLGKIKKKNQDVVDLEIHNPESESIFLLNYQCEYPMRFLANRPFIEAGGTEVYRIKVNPREEGEFEQTLQLYFSHSETPFLIRLTGDVEELPVNDLQKCPSFKDLPSKRDLVRNQRRAQGNIQEFAISLGEGEPKEILAEEVKEDTIIEANTVATPAIILDPIPESQTAIAAEEAVLLGDEYLPNNIIFLIDASSSMEDEARFELLKISLIELLKPLRSIDYLSMISYAGEAELLLAPTSSLEKDSIGKVINSLKASGSTNAVKGIDLALETAYDSFIEGGNNEIYLVTDGAFSLGSRNRRSRNDLQEAADYGIEISVLAVKSDRIARKSLKEISKLGNGKLIRIERDGDKDKVLEAIKRSSLR